MNYSALATIGSAEPPFTEALRGIALDGEDRLVAVGDNAVQRFDASGRPDRSWKTDLPGYAVAVDPTGNVWVGQWEQVEIFDRAGKLLDTRRDPRRLGLVTSIDFLGDEVFLGDATARHIHRYSADGTFLNDIGDRHRKGGFHIPNGVVDFAIDAEGVLHVANPGLHRVERYRPDGELLGRFGRFDGQDPAGFPGCCNPTNLTLDKSGRVFVTEKAGPRAKLYDAAGELIAVIAADVFDPQAKNMDLAVDARGRVYVADTARLEIRVFAPVPEEAAR